MSNDFKELLAVGGKSNSLGKANEVIELVLKDRQRLNELYNCLFDEDAWVRMRAADAFEKVCRQHPGWLLPYIDKISTDLSISGQASIQWHLAQIYRQVDLTAKQKHFAIHWLKGLLSSKDVDWIVSANAMDTLVQFAKDGSCPISDIVPLLHIQQGHKSNAVIKRANKWLAEIAD